MLLGTDFSELYDAAREEVFGEQPDKLVLQQHLHLLKLTPSPPLNTLAQPVVGMFPPTSLISTPCPPKSFDFYTCSNDDLLEFTIPIDFIVSRTSLVHGLASWFDLDFQPRPAPAEEEVNWNFPVAPNSAWQWMTQEQPLNPGPTPPPPADGLTVTLSTGPNGELRFSGGLSVLSGLTCFC